MTDSSRTRGPDFALCACEDDDDDDDACAADIAGASCASISLLLRWAGIGATPAIGHDVYAAEI
jgi:hypothetical protein